MDGRDSRGGRDKANEPEWPIERGSRQAQREPSRSGETIVRSRTGGFSPILLALVGLLLVLGLIWYFTGNRSADQDKLKDTQVSQAQPQSAEKRCASSATYDLIKRELFRRAAQLRGSDQASYDRLSAVASLRMENPVMESEKDEAVNCSGSLSLDLPPGVAAVGGRTSLMADVDYTVQPAADGSGMVVLLRNADAIIAPLATLARTGTAPAQAQPTPGDQPAGTPGPDASPQPAQPTPAPPVAAPQAPAPATPVRQASARPSFDCGKARTRGEIAVCSDAGLAALDRNMAARYVRAVEAASPAQRDLLRQTRDRFLRYRDRCSNNSCVGDAYVGRMREIRDIMEGRWQPSR